jgi:cytochrome P450
MTIEFKQTVDEEASLTALGELFDISIWGTDAQQVWAELQQHGPVVFSNPAMAVTTSPAAVHESLHDPSIFSSNPSAMYFGSDTGAIPLQVDPPLHSRYRKLLDPLFTPKKMTEREPQAIELVNGFIDGFIERGSCDFSAEFAVPFPTAMFLSLMGMPFDELTDFLKVKEEMIRPPGPDEQSRIAVQEKASMWICDYINTAMAAREKGLGDDILSYFLTLERDGKLTRAETLNICILFLPAGLDTVTDTLECSFAFLSQNPTFRQRLASDPDVTARAVEELLRYESPVPSVSRVAMSDTSLGGCPIAKGTRVRSLLSIANHDPDVFGNPETMDFDRVNNPHIAFGGGVHRCVGSHLARLELRVAMREWHKRIPDYWLTAGTKLKYRQALREITYLPLEFAPGGRTN